MAAVRVYGALGLDEMLRLIGSWPQLVWRLYNAEVLWLDESDRRAAAEIFDRVDASFDPNGAAVSWNWIQALASDGRQVINGTLVGYEAGAPRVSIASVDSSFWVIWANDAAIVDAAAAGLPSSMRSDDPPLRRWV